MIAALEPFILLQLLKLIMLYLIELIFFYDLQTDSSRNRRLCEVGGINVQRLFVLNLLNSNMNKAH